MGSSSRLTLLLTTPCLSLLLHHRPFHFRLARLSLSTATHRLSGLSLLSIKAANHIHTTAINNNSSSSTLREDNFGDSHSFFSNPRASHPWPEWSHLVHTLTATGYFDQQHRQIGGGVTGREDDDNEFVAYENLSEDFVRAAGACLAFARNRSDILWSLSRKDIVVIVENGTPFLFKSALDSSRRMRSFLDSGRTNVSQVLGSGTAEMVDLMKYLLSYASNPSVSVSSESNNLYSRDKIESSVRNLLNELSQMSSSNSRVQEHYQVSQTPKPLVGQQNIEMKRGDWICPKCTFMNFARNQKCLECEESRPKRQLTGGEWECPQCDFFNYGRNITCLRCDCKRPGEVSLGTFNPRPANNGDYASASKKNNLDSSNVEKAGRLFNSVPQQNNMSDLPNEDFPEIMPLRKGENKFVVSTRKTPLERRLENSHSSQAGGEVRTVDSSSINRSLDQILGPPSSKTESRYKSNFTPFVPLPADMFAKKTQNPEIGKPQDAKSSDGTNFVMESGECNEDREYSPDMMPVRKGENRFVVSKMKDRSFTSPTYKRQMADEQASNSSKFVPFVPFPPDYFAKKQPTESTVKDSKTDQESSSQNTETQKDSFTSQSSVVSNNNSTIRKESTASKNLGSENVNVRNLGGENTNINKSGGWSGKSLEGSAVKETDPLDMSEEAKAERWFRRVAQIKDISELSQIPDEDFPSIMPMRKGVNRFVVSKRKTPLERRLTSPQYRRNLPVYERSDPPLPPNKENNDGN